MSDITTIKVTISSPPNTVFTLHNILDSRKDHIAYPESATPTPKSSPVLMWIEDTPLQLIPQENESYSEVTELTAKTTDPTLSEAELESLLWGQLSDHIKLTDEDRIKSEVESAITVLPEAYTHAINAKEATTNTIETANRIESKQGQISDFHMAIEEIAESISTITSHLQNCKTILHTFRDLLLDRDVKDTKYNTQITTLISTCDNYIDDYENLINKLENLTPQSLSPTITALTDKLDSLNSRIQNLTTELDDIYKEVTGTSIQKAT